MSALVRGALAATLLAAAAVLTPVPASAKVDRYDLYGAPVPAGLCEHPAGHLIDGGRDFGDDGQDGIDEVRYGRISGGATAVAIIGCNAGGVSWPQTLVFYRRLQGEPAILGSYDLGRIRRAEHVQVESAKIADGRLVARLATYEGAGFEIRKYQASFHVRNGRVVVADIHRGPLSYPYPD